MPLDLIQGDAAIRRNYNVPIGYLSDEIVKRAIALQNSVRSFRSHPSQNSRAHLKAECNALSGAFSIAMKMIGYRELPDAIIGNELKTVRYEVMAARKAVESLYDKKKGKK